MRSDGSQNAFSREDYFKDETKTQQNRVILQHVAKTKFALPTTTICSKQQSPAPCPHQIFSVAILVSMCRCRLRVTALSVDSKSQKLHSSLTTSPPKILRAEGAKEMTGVPSCRAAVSFRFRGKQKRCQFPIVQGRRSKDKVILCFLSAMAALPREKMGVVVQADPIARRRTVELRESSRNQNTDDSQTSRFSFRSPRTEKIFFLI